LYDASRFDPTLRSSGRVRAAKRVLFAARVPDTVAKSGRLKEVNSGHE